MSDFGFVVGAALAGYYLASPLIGEAWASHVAAIAGTITATAIWWERHAAKDDPEER